VSTVPNAYGNFLSSSPPFISNYAAIAGPHGTYIKPGGCVAAYVRSTGAQDGDDLFAASGNLVTTINEGLKRCRSGQNDIVFVLPGHVENIDAADDWPDLVAGTQVVGCGRPGASNNPTLTWTATASTILLNVADVSIIGLNLNWAGIDNVAAPITVSAAGCAMFANHITVQSATASAGAVQGVDVASGGSGFRFVGNRCLSDDEGEPLTGGGIVEVSAAVNDVVVSGNFMSGAAANTVGLILVSAAATNVTISDNWLYNLETTSGDACIVIGNVAATGIVCNNYNKFMTAGDPNAADIGIFYGAAATTIGSFENYSVDDTFLQAILAEPHPGT
jgi:hypothetical protein